METDPVKSRWEQWSEARQSIRALNATLDALERSLSQPDAGMPEFFREIFGKKTQ